MLHGRAKLLGLMLTCSLFAGCKQQLFVAEQDLQALGKTVPLNLERDASACIVPSYEKALTPPTVNFPDRRPVYLSLEEAIARGLETGSNFSRQPFRGEPDDTLGSMSAPVFGRPGQFNGETEDVRVLALYPAQSFTFLETQLSRYDVQMVTSMQWSNVDSLQQGLQSFQNGSGAAFANSFIKALPSGGTANVSYLNEYKLLSSPPVGSFGVLNPSYTARLVFGIDQPLWRDFGTDINQMLGRHPAASPLSPLGRDTAAGSAYAGRQNGIASQDGILVARLRHSQQKAEFERQMQSLVLNIEVAYWNLYKAYGRLYAFEEALRIAHRSWMINKAKFDVGAKGPGDYYPFKAQYEEFRGERDLALGGQRDIHGVLGVLEAERNLRGLIGLPIEDGARLVPVTPPTQACWEPNYEAAINDALMYRPELAMVRENLQQSFINMTLAKNSLRPDLHAAANYSPVGFGTRLDGNGGFLDGIGVERPTNAHRSLASDHFNDWNIGLILNIPLGYRAEMAQVRSARLDLARSYYLLKDHELRAKRFVSKEFQAVTATCGLIEKRRNERKDYGEAVEARYKEFAVGKAQVDQFLLDMQRRFASALVKEYEAIADYNTALARFEWSKGTILAYNKVYLSEGKLPECAQVRAVEHEKERTRAWMLHEKPRPLAAPGQFVQGHGEVTGEPNWDHLTGREPAETTPAPVMEPLPTPRKPPLEQLRNETPSTAPPATSSQTIEFRRAPLTQTPVDPGAPAIFRSAPATTTTRDLILPQATDAPRDLPMIPTESPPFIQLPPLPGELSLPDPSRGR